MQEKQSFSKLWRENQKLRHAIVLILNTALFMSVYFVLLRYADLTQNAYYSFLVMILYMALFLGFLLAYLIYNRFLYRKGLTVEDLPDTMSAEEKEAFIADGKRRLQKSKWMMLIILPLVITFLVDAVDLFVLDLFR